MSEITSIYLENFQSIKDAVELPIRPLTFLYGPNSSGKSAVHDALYLLNVALTSGDGMADLIRRWTHVNASLTDTSKMVIGVSLRVRGEFGESALIERVEFPDEFDEEPLSIFAIDIDAELSIKLRFGSDYQEADGFSVWLNKQLVFEISSQHEDHGTYVTLAAEYFGASLKNVISRYGFDPEAIESYRVECYFDRKPLRLRAILREDSQRRRLNSAILAIANYALTSVISWYLMPVLVAADRGALDDSHLTFFARAYANVRWLDQADSSLFEGGVGDSTQQSFPSFSRLRHLVHVDLIHKTSNPIRPIGESRLGTYIQNKVKEQEGIGLRSGGDMTPRLLQELAEAPNSRPPEFLYDYVNRCLSDHLFLDRGYQVDFDICEVLRPDSVGPPAGLPYITKASVFGGFSLHVLALVVCFLRERSGQLVTFADVGTGLSCVLPVLTALHSGYSFAQQPELHLHPAMQSALADIYIERAGCARERHLIESHSEYILLRCLRRIRETSTGRRPLDDPQALGPDQVSILYFDPQPDGSTKVRKIRVTKDGEFIDRWPRGFFAERGKDLFDE